MDPLQYLLTLLLITLVCNFPSNGGGQVFSDSESHSPASPGFGIGIGGPSQSHFMSSGHGHGFGHGHGHGHGHSHGNGNGNGNGNVHGHVHPQGPGDEETGDGPANPEAAAARERCSFPPRWEGDWFQSGVHQTITISRHTINAKGRCLEADGEKFIVYNERDNCYRCVVFHEKHQNVMQYKETFCIPERRSLRSMCSSITGDANLFSMFRLDSVPIECPFRGPFTFTYNRGHGDCRYPASSIDSCLHSSHLLLNYQACPDIPGTESTVEELQCLATWKEGSSRYLLGLITFRHSASYEDRFRCFVYDKMKRGGLLGGGGGGVGGSGFSHSSNNHPGLGGSLNFNSHHNNNSDVLLRVSQSGDATCNGISSIEGSRVLTLRRAAIPKTCQFPPWLQNKKQWQTLDERSTFIFETNELRVTNMTEIDGLSANVLTMTAACSQIQESPTLDKVVLVLHKTSDCQSGFICTAIYRREGHIIELQMGNLARRLEDACQSSNYNQHYQPFITLVSSGGETRQCPNIGKFHVTGLNLNGRHLSDKCAQGINSLNVGCSSLDTLQFRSECSTSDVVAEYTCHGWWEEKGVSYLITSPVGSSTPSPSSSSATPSKSKSKNKTRHRRYCFVFREDLSKASPPSQSQVISEQLRHHSVDNGFIDDPGVLVVGENPFSLEFGKTLLFSSMADSCHRNVHLGVDGALAFNVTSQGECNGINGGMSIQNQKSKQMKIVILLTSTLAFTALIM